MNPSSQKTTLKRPLFHFTPPHGWMNDPNGLVYHAGEYHLFYQYYPHDLVWGPMHWGHAVSSDLVNWEHLPIALEPGAEGYIFSGSAVVDHHNTAGFGPNALVAIYTIHYWLGEGETDQVQDQGIAYSLDNGRNWIKYAGNPVIRMPEGLGHSDFRDPKVFWYGSQESGHWVMILSVSDQVWLYTSKDLKTWTKASEFGRGYGCHGSVWECPDLFEMPVEGSEQTRWVMIVSVQDGAPAGGNGVQYFVGDFDGQTFIPSEAPHQTRWLDLGPDFYAAVSWSNVPEGRRLIVGWMNNWPYARKIPATDWRGMQSVVRELKLHPAESHFLLSQTPVFPERYWQEEISLKQPLSINSDGIRFQPLDGCAGLIKIKWKIDGPASADYFGIKLYQGEGQYTTIGIDRKQSQLYIDRQFSGNSVSEMLLSSLHEAEMVIDGDTVDLLLIFDCQSIEVFVNDGKVGMTELIFPDCDKTGYTLFAIDGSVMLEDLSIKLIR